MQACNITEERLRPKVGESISDPTNGERSNSMEAEVEERMDNI
jgi:hypothetical protein